MRMLSWRRGDESHAASETALEAARNAYLARYSSIEQHLDALIGGKKTYSNRDKSDREGGLFPEEHHSFRKPEPLTLFAHAVATAKHVAPPAFMEILRLRKPAPEHERISKRIDVLLAMSIIRYIDNFLDEALWPRIAEYKAQGKGEELRARVERLLAAGEELAVRSGTYLSHELTELPRLELAIELDPASFDRNIIPLVEYKSLDIHHLRTIASSGPGSLKRSTQIRPPKGTAAWTEYTATCIGDVARDFRKRHEHDTDFNLRRFLLEQKGNCNPSVLIEYVRGVIEDLRFLIRGTELPHEADKSPAQYIPRLEQFIRDLENTYAQAKTMDSRTA